MRGRRKPLSEQVMVITGASSGIGLVTAFMGVQRGASLVLASRNESDLDEITECIQRKGGRAIWVKADVADRDQVERVADEAVRAFGRIDTWVNNAGVSMYGRLTDLDPADMRRQMDVNFWGVVHGSLTAVRRMQDAGGVIINNASITADRAIPHQGIYCASKHATRAFSDTLRMELELDRIPVAVSLIKPGSVDTPFFDKARTYFPEEPQPVPPVYAPEVVAGVILACAERPFREMTVGAAFGMLGLGQKVSPRLTDRYLERSLVRRQRTGRPLSPGRVDNLYQPLPHDGGERGRNWQGRVFQQSVVTESRIHPRRTGLAVAGAGLALVLGSRLLRGRNGPEGKL